MLVLAIQLLTTINMLRYDILRQIMLNCLIIANKIVLEAELLSLSIYTKHANRFHFVLTQHCSLLLTDA